MQNSEEIIQNLMEVRLALETTIATLENCEFQNLAVKLNESK